RAIPILTSHYKSVEMKIDKQFRLEEKRFINRQAGLLGEQSMFSKAKAKERSRTYDPALC
uniref:hypothetical protein n=1 Tax=Larkinella soli TaxID=1770527 RepID=UPI0019CFC0C0